MITPVTKRLEFRGSWLGVLAPFALFLSGVTWLALAGAPDERGFWPILLAALTLGLLLVRDRTHYCEVVLGGMSQPIVMVMIMAWLLSGVLGAILSASGFVEALVWLARAAGLQGAGYVVAAFLACAVVSTATGTSFGTLLLAGPLLYPAGAAVAAHPAVLMGAILGGATFGDSISPVSDTTIASAGTQGADIGGVVRSRLKYVLPAGAIAALASGLLNLTRESVGASAAAPLPTVSARGLPMLAIPIVVIALLVAKRHLLEGLLFGGREDVMYVFHDPAQAIYRDDSVAGLGMTEYPLDLNCRNAQPIHDVVRRFAGEGLASGALRGALLQLLPLDE